MDNRTRIRTREANYLRLSGLFPQRLPEGFHGPEPGKAQDGRWNENSLYPQIKVRCLCIHPDWIKKACPFPIPCNPAQLQAPQTL